MKQTIEHQNQVMTKREKLVFAITNNVQYLAQLHRVNVRELQ